MQERAGPGLPGYMVSSLYEVWCERLALPKRFLCKMHHDLMSLHNLGFGRKQINMISNCLGEDKAEESDGCNIFA